jgi:hypothetical protein
LPPSPIVTIDKVITDKVIIDHYRRTGCCPCKKSFSECIKIPTGDQCPNEKNISCIQEEFINKAYKASSKDKNE